LADWLGAAAAAEERTHFHHGIAHTDALIAHHEIVKGLAWLPNRWAVAIEYDIQQREMVLRNPSHDLCILDVNGLALITLSIMLLQNSHSAHHVPSSGIPHKRMASSDPAILFCMGQGLLMLLWQFLHQLPWMQPLRRSIPQSQRLQDPIRTLVEWLHHLTLRKQKPYCVNTTSWTIGAIL